MAIKWTMGFIMDHADFCLMEWKSDSVVTVHARSRAALSRWHAENFKKGRLNICYVKEFEISKQLAKSILVWWKHPQKHVKTSSIWLNGFDVRQKEVR